MVSSEKISFNLTHLAPYINLIYNLINFYLLEGLLEINSFSLYKELCTEGNSRSLKFYPFLRWSKRSIFKLEKFLLATDIFFYI
jgi:hypothetical protein